MFWYFFVVKIEKKMMIKEQSIISMEIFEKKLNLYWSYKAFYFTTNWFYSYKYLAVWSLCIIAMFALRRIGWDLSLYMHHTRMFFIIIAYNNNMSPFIALLIVKD